MAKFQLCLSRKCSVRNVFVIKEEPRVKIQFVRLVKFSIFSKWIGVKWNPHMVNPPNGSISLIWGLSDSMKSVVSVFVGDGQPGDGAAAAVSWERHVASSQSQEDGEEESLVRCESRRNMLEFITDVDADEMWISFANWHMKSFFLNRFKYIHVSAFCLMGSQI